jgi:hypothetical protein
LPDTVLLLDGGTGPRPPTAMDCTLDGGFRCGECMHHSECPAGHACVINRRTRRFECVASECEDDQGCFPGTTCRVVATPSPQQLIRRCVPSGARAEGEFCELAPASPSDACREGLLCWDAVCRTPCTPGLSGACPSGQRCHDTRLDGALCVPDCREGGCAAGETCVQASPGSHQCVTLGVDECGEDRPCPDGQHCLVRAQRGRAGRFCAAPCKSWLGSQACPEGFVCGRGGPELSSCYRLCDSQKPDTCPPGWSCTTVSEDKQTWGCRPDIRR